MNAKQYKKSDRTIDRQINLIDMFDCERVAGLHTAHIDGLFADGVVWIIGKFERLCTNVFVNAGTKYWELVGSGSINSVRPRTNTKPLSVAPERARVGDRLCSC